MSNLFITGIGVISNIGSSKEAFWNNMLRQKCGLSEVEFFDNKEFCCKVAGVIDDFDAKQHMDIKGLRYMDRSEQLSLCAAVQAIRDSGFIVREEDRANYGIALGNTFGSLKSIYDFDMTALKEGYMSLNPADFQNTVINAASSNIAIKLGICGPNVTISSGFAASLDSIGYCMDMMEAHGIEMMLAGGVEELNLPFCQYLYSIGALGAYGTVEDASGYTGRHDGVIPGEGSVVFVIENEQSALKREAGIYGRLSGYYRAFSPECSSRNLQVVMEKAIECAGMDADDIDIVISSKNGSVQGELETAAIRGVFGNRAEEMTICNVKQLIGETYSAGGAFQVMAGLGLMSSTEIRARTTRSKAPVVILNSYGISGSNTSLVLKGF